MDEFGNGVSVQRSLCFHLQTTSNNPFNENIQTIHRMQKLILQGELDNIFSLFLWVSWLEIWYLLPRNCWYVHLGWQRLKAHSYCMSIDHQQRTCTRSVLPVEANVKKLSKSKLDYPERIPSNFVFVINVDV